MRYPKYDDSGIQWLPLYPSSWRFTKIGKAYSSTLGKMLAPNPRSDNDVEKPYLCAKDVHFSGVSTRALKKMWFSPEEISKFSVNKGDLLVVEGGAVGNAAIYNDEIEVYAQNALHIVSGSDNARTQWLYYWLYYLEKTGYVASVCNKSTIMHYTHEKLNDTFLFLPSKQEQDQIVLYLDWKTSQFNRLINNKKKEIALLQEQKKNMISTLVFHGINPNAERGNINLKFVDWIPSHWKTVRGRFLFSEHDLRSETGEEELLSVSHITGVTPRSQKNVTMFKAESLVGYKVCDVHDIAANIMWMWQGAIAVSQYKGVISPSYCTLHQIEGAYEERYLDYLLRAKPMVDEYLRLSTGIRKSRLRLYPDQFLAMYFPVPPFEEQRQIADYIEEKAKGIDELIEKTEKQISVISELKTRCISDVVTGQIDVRDIEIPEYEYVADSSDEEESEDDEEVTELEQDE